MTPDAIELRAPMPSDLAALRALLDSNGWAHRLGDDAWLAQLVASSRSLGFRPSSDAMERKRASREAS